MAKQKSPKRNKKKTTMQEGLSAPLDKSAKWSAFRSKSFRFTAAFILSCIGLYTLILALPDRFTGLINENSAHTLGLILSSFGIPVSVAGDVVSGSSFALQIIPECTAVFMVGMFFCFIVFSPATVRQKASGLALGIPALYLGNLVRLVVMFMVGQYDRRLFETVHAFWGHNIYHILGSPVLHPVAEMD
jgi:exosortase/archaeosortase family protein